MLPKEVLSRARSSFCFMMLSLCFFFAMAMGVSSDGHFGLKTLRATVLVVSLLVLAYSGSSFVKHTLLYLKPYEEKNDTESSPCRD